VLQRYACIAAAERVRGADNLARMVANADVDVAQACGRWVVRNGRAALEPAE